MNYSKKDKERAQEKLAQRYPEDRKGAAKNRNRNPCKDCQSKKLGVRLEILRQYPSHGSFHSAIEWKRRKALKCARAV
jgi:hypothetical protein